jgi:hypothetical protein
LRLCDRKSLWIGKLINLHFLWTDINIKLIYSSPYKTMGKVWIVTPKKKVKNLCFVTRQIIKNSIFFFTSFYRIRSLSLNSFSFWSGLLWWTNNVKQTVTCSIWNSNEFKNLSSVFFLTSSSSSMTWKCCNS